MFENENVNENVENVNENGESVQTEQVVEQVEQPAKTYTQDEVDAIVSNRLARQAAKIHKENERNNAEQNELIEILKAGTKQETVAGLKDNFQKFYASKGIKVPEKPTYSAKDIEILANAEAQEFISAGFDDVVEEVNRLSNLGIENMSARDKVVFRNLAEYRRTEERSRELSKLGVSPEVASSKDFRDFAAKFNVSTPIAEIYDIYKSRTPKKEIHTMGSMRAVQPAVKDYYSPEEIERLTEEDLDDPKVWEAVRRSMTGRA